MDKDLLHNLSNTLNLKHLLQDAKNNALGRGGPLKIKLLKKGASKSQMRSMSPSSPKKPKDVTASPAELLFKILRTANVKDKSEEAELETNRKTQKKTVINNYKCYDYGSGEVKEYERSNFYFALEAFEKVYEAVIKQDLEVNSQKRKFDFQSLLSLIKGHLQKILEQFSTWTEKEKKDVDEIIARAEKSYFAGRLNKLFLSDKQKYKEIDVFKRLNDIEVVSLSRLFKQIKFMLMNKKESYLSPVVSRDHKKNMFLGLPPAKMIEANIEDAQWMDFIKDPEVDAPPGMSQKQMNLLARRFLPAEELEGLEAPNQRLQMRLHKAYQKSGRNLQLSGSGILSGEFPNDTQNKKKLEVELKSKFLENGASVIHRHIRKMIIKALYKFSQMNVKLLRPENKQTHGPVKTDFFKEQAKVKNYDIIILKEESEELDISSDSSPMASSSAEVQPAQTNVKPAFKTVDLDFPSEAGLLKFTSEYLHQAAARKANWDLFKRKHARASPFMQTINMSKGNPTEDTNKQSLIPKRSEVANDSKAPLRATFTQNFSSHRKTNSFNLPVMSPRLVSQQASPLPKSNVPKSIPGISLPSLSPGLTRVNSLAMWPQKQPSSPGISTSKHKWDQPKPISQPPEKKKPKQTSAQAEQEQQVFRDHIIGGREVLKDKLSNVERKAKDNRKIVEYLNSKFEASNRAFIDLLEKHMISILSDACLDGIANQNPRCVPEFRRALKQTLTQFLPSAIVLQKGDLAIKEGKIMSTKDERPKQTEVFSSFFKLDASNFHVDAHLLNAFKKDSSTRENWRTWRGSHQTELKQTPTRLPPISQRQSATNIGLPQAPMEPVANNIDVKPSASLLSRKKDTYNKPRLNVHQRLALLS